MQVSVQNLARSPKLFLFSNDNCKESKKFGFRLPLLCFLSGLYNRKEKSNREKSQTLKKKTKKKQTANKKDIV